MKKQRKFTLILLGDPAAGKDTQSKLLAKKYNLHVFSSGQALRDLKARDPEVAKLLARDFDKGGFTLTSIVKRLYLENFQTAPKSRELLLNGNPRKPGEARITEKLIREFKRPSPIVVYLSIPNKEIFKRSKIRASTAGRVDDYGPENRIKARDTFLLKTFAYLKKHHPAAKVSGMGTVRQVNERIVKAIEKMLSNS